MTRKEERAERINYKYEELRGKWLTGGRGSRDK